MQQEQTKIVCTKIARSILDIVVNNFRTNYIPDREISLDEGMLGWRDRLRFCVYKMWKNIEKLDFCVLSVVFLCIQKAATHDITRRNITEGMF